MNKATGANRGDQRRGSAPSRADHGAGAEMISERSRSQREHNCRPDGRANLLPRCANSTRDQKLRLRKPAGLPAIAAMLVIRWQCTQLFCLHDWSAGVPGNDRMWKLSALTVIQRSCWIPLCRSRAASAASGSAWSACGCPRMRKRPCRWRAGRSLGASLRRSGRRWRGS